MNHALFCPRPSHTARALARVLGVRRLRQLDGFPREEDWVVINYGCSNVPTWDYGVTWINHPIHVTLALSKIRTYMALRDADVPCVRATLDPGVASAWVTDGYRVLTRRDGLARGRGILEGVHPLRPGGFYARVFPKTHEFRVHVGKGKIIDLVEKKKRREQEDVNRLIRTHENGWVFAHDNLSVGDEDRGQLEDLAIRAVKPLGLDFGAVDVLAILNTESPRRLSKAVVCEVNTAPGLSSPTTFNRYLTFFNSEVFSHHGNA